MCKKTTKCVSHITNFQEIRTFPVKIPLTCPRGTAVWAISARCVSVPMRRCFCCITVRLWFIFAEKMPPHVGRHTNGLFYLLQLLCAELLQNRYISHGCFPDDIPAHAPIAMSDQIAHTLYWPSLNSVCSRGSVFRRKLASQFTDLEYAEGNRTLIICIFIKYLERIPVTSYCLFNLDAIIPYMLKPLRIRRQHTNSPSRL